MPRRSIPRSLVGQVANSFRNRSFQSSNSRQASTISTPPHAPELTLSPVASSSSSNPLLYAQRSRLNDLKDAFKNKDSPAAIWGTYTNVLSALGADSLPLELHQEVLRKCTPADSELRAAAIRRLAAGNIPSFPHIHEARFQTIMRNIRSLGSQPDLEDYNFILRQFAAVGHYEGSYQVYNEIQRVGHIPSSKTFGLCFQSIAYRLSLPISKAKREGVIKQIDAMYAMYMEDMKKHSVPMTGVNFELSLRILKHTLNRAGFESVMRWGYGVDLSNPDHVALEYGPNAARTKDGKPVKPFPFTTSALNTTLDMLGRLGDVSKLVQAFEVLTQPLPNASQHFFNSFDEDDDFGVGVDVTTPGRFAPPYAQPNTTTYTILLRHICQTPYESVFARHYLLQAIRLDRFVDMTLRRKYWAKTPLEEIPSPHFSLNRNLLLSVLGQSNKHKDMSLMSWLASKMPYLLRKKKGDLEFYTEMKEARDRALRENPPAATPHMLLGVRGTIDHAKNRKEEPDVFDLDVSSIQPPEVQEPKPFDVDLHVDILRRNVHEMEEFNKRLEYVLGRTTQRVKERLGRRIWAGKDVFFMDQGKRVKTTRERWKEVVNFKDRKDAYDNLKKRKYGTPLNKVQHDRSYSTMIWPVRSSSLWSRRPAPPTPMELLRSRYSQS